MGFKNSGFPHYGFNPIGFRSNTPIPYKSDALHFSKAPAQDGELKDRTGQSDRSSVITKKIVGDGSTYVDTGIVPVDDADWYWEVKGKFLNLNTQVMGQFTSNPPTVDQFYWGINSSKWYFVYKDLSASSVDNADTEEHIFRIFGNGIMIIDDNIVHDLSSGSGSIDGKDLYLLARNGATLLQCNFDLYYSKFHYPDGSEIIFPGGEEITDITTQTSIVSTDGQHTAQFYLSDANTIQDDYRALSVCDAYGYTLADGASIYKDEGATVLYADGQPISAKLINGTYSKLYCKGYDSEGNPYPLDYVGRVKHQIRVVDGVVDLENQEELGNIVDDTNTSHVINVAEITTTNSVAGLFLDTNMTITSDNTEKTIVFKGEIISGTERPVIQAKTLADTVIVQQEATLDNTEYRFKFTPTDGGYIIKFFATFATSETASKRYYDFSIYEGDYVTGTPALPTSDQPVSGNSIIAKEQYPLIQQADTNDILTTGTGDVKDNRVRAVDDIANIEYQQAYCQKDGDGDIRKYIFYDRELTSEESTRVERVLGFLELALDSEGEIAVDSEGNIAFAPKDGITEVS